MAGEDGRAAPHPDPARVQTVGELAAALKQLKGRRTYKELEAAGKKAGRLELPGESTVSDLLKTGRCSRVTLEGFLVMCRIPHGRQEAWLAAWERTRTPTGPRGAVRVRDTSWQRLGVHHPIHVPGVDPDTLPVYVPRDIDNEPKTGLRARLAAAAAEGGFVVLVGGSSTGKTRSLMEAVHAQLSEWWLLRPSDPEELAALAADPPPRLVLWLDELQNHLGDGGLTVSVAERLIGGGCVLVGTLWHFSHRRYTTAPAAAFGSGPPADPHQRERQTLALAHVIRLPEQPTDAEDRRASALAAGEDGDGGDARLREALRYEGYGFPQTIAAAPQLVDHWTDANPYEAAVLTAAVDAVRLGVGTPLPAGLLRAAAPGYCSQAERAQAPADWFESALAYATQRLHGAVAALTPITDAMSMGDPTGYRLADYLLHHVQPARYTRCPPATFWDACIDHITDRSALVNLGHCAADRMRYCYAIPLLHRALNRLDAFADQQNWQAGHRLVWLLLDQDNIDNGSAILRDLAENGDPIAWYQLANFQDIADEIHANAQRDSPSPQTLTRLLRGLGGSRMLRRQLAASGEPPAAQEARLAAIFGSPDDLRRRFDADNGDINAACRLVDLLATKGDFDEALPILRILVDSGAPECDSRLIAMLAEMGKPKEALRLAKFGLAADGSVGTRPAHI